MYLLCNICKNMIKIIVEKKIYIFLIFWRIMLFLIIFNDLMDMVMFFLFMFIMYWCIKVLGMVSFVVV